MYLLAPRVISRFLRWHTIRTWSWERRTRWNSWNGVCVKQTEVLSVLPPTSVLHPISAHGHIYPYLTQRDKNASFPWYSSLCGTKQPHRACWSGYTHEQGGLLTLETSVTENTKKLWLCRLKWRWRGPRIAMRAVSTVFSPGCWSLGLTWEFRRSLWLRFHSILSLRFRYFAKLCNYLIRHHTPLIVFSMEMAPCHRDYMVCGCLHCNLIVAYYTIVVERLPSSSSSWESLSKHYSGYNCRPMYSMGDV